MIKDSVGGWKQGAKTISGLGSYFQRPEVKGLKWRPIFCPTSKADSSSKESLEKLRWGPRATAGTAMLRQYVAMS
jgi:hypothetical protein